MSSESPAPQEPAPRQPLRLSLDWWAVLTALGLVLLVLLGILPTVPW